MNRRKFLARSISAGGATFIATTRIEAKPTSIIPKKFNSELKQAIIQESNMGCSQGIGFMFTDKECRYRRIAFEIDQGCPPCDLAHVLREMANACEDPDHPMWVKGDRMIGDTTIKPKL